MDQRENCYNFRCKISANEVSKALRKLKSEKIIGQDDVSFEVRKCTREVKI